MNDIDRFIELWNDYLEGDLDKAGFAELRERALGNDQLLKIAADSFQTHRLLGMLAHDTGSQRKTFIRETLNRLIGDDDQFVEEVMQHLPAESHTKRKTLRTSFLKWVVSTAAAISILLALNLVFLLTQSDPEIARITKLNGTVCWTGNGGMVIPSITAGSSLTGGTLEGMSADSWADIEFSDGSTVTLSGQSRLTISEKGRKMLHLRSGNLSADVAKQPEEREMVILTPTAKLDVLGTQLNVATQPALTKLNVNRGRVRFTRLVDGTSVDVPAEHQIVASVDRRSKLKAVSSPQPVAAWQGDLVKNKLHGQVMSNGHVRSEPFLYQHKGESVILHLVALSVYCDQTAPVQLSPGSRFVVHGLIKTSCRVWCAVSTKHINGGFTGKFVFEYHFTDVPESGLPLDLEIPIESFQPNEKELAVKLPNIFPPSPVGLELLDWSCSTTNEDAELEISHVELVPADKIPDNEKNND